MISYSFAPLSACPAIPNLPQYGVPGKVAGAGVVRGTLPESRLCRRYAVIRQLALLPFRIARDEPESFTHAIPHTNAMLPIPARDGDATLIVRTESRGDFRTGGR